MLHEILFALLGKCGNIIIETEEAFILDPRITFLSPAEKEIINQLCQLGYHYSNIERFLDENYNASFKSQSVKLPGQQQQSTLARQLEVQDDPNNDGPIAEVHVIGNSAYLKGVCIGMETILSEYREEIIQIERSYLDNRVFTIASLKVTLTKYFDILPDLHRSVQFIVSENLKGGQLLDLMESKSQTGNTSLNRLYSTLAQHAYSVLYQQLSGWMLYGMLQDLYDEFFVYRVEQNINDDQNALTAADTTNDKNTLELEHDWDSVFSLRYAMLPQSVISYKQAEKILFIGKGIRILRNTQESSSSQYRTSFLPPDSMLSLLGEIQVYDSFKFQNTIESLRYEIARQLLELVLKQQNLMYHLSTLNQCFLMGNGEFFKAFYEESRSTMQLPPKQESENILNTFIVPHTLIKIKSDEDTLNMFKNFKFRIKNSGFEFKEFASLQELNIVGNVQLQRNHYMRFQPLRNSKLSGSLWYRYKQNIETGFKMNFTFRFKKERVFLPQNQLISKLGSPLVQFQPSPNIQDTSPMKSRFSLLTPSAAGEDRWDNGLLIVFQNIKELSSHKKSAPSRLADMSEYIAVKFYAVEANKTKSTMKNNINNSTTKEEFSNECRIDVIACTKGNSSVVLSQKLDPDRVNFIEGQLQVIRINYDGETFSLSLEDIFNMNRGAQSQLFSIPLKFSNFMQLDMGRAYVGFIQESNHGNCAMDIMSWSMFSANVFNNEDAWNGLTMDYSAKWPLSLIISSHLIEKYKNLFRYLFPLRTIQCELQRNWLYFMKNHKKNSLGPLQNKMLIMRTKLSSVIDSLLTYFHQDIIALQWQKLQEKVAEVKDFEELRKLVELFLNSISLQLFLAYPKLVRSIFDVVDCCRKFCHIVAKLEYETSLDNIEGDFQQIKEDFDKHFLNLLNLLILMTKNTNATFLFQLLLRLDYNGYYREQIEDKYKY